MPITGDGKTSRKSDGTSSLNARFCETYSDDHSPRKVRSNRKVLKASSNLAAILRHECTLGDSAGWMPTPERLKADLPEILTLSGIPDAEILMVLLVGSHARRAATRFSDVDFDVYCKTFSGDIWFMYKGALISLIATKYSDVIAAITNSTSISWYRGVIATAPILVDRNNLRAELDATIRAWSDKRQTDSFTLDLRRVLEYRRKLLSLSEDPELDESDPHFAIGSTHCAHTYIQHYLNIIGYLHNIVITSDRNFIREVSSVLPNEVIESLASLINPGEPFTLRLRSLSRSFSYMTKTLLVFSHSLQEPESVARDLSSIPTASDEFCALDDHQPLSPHSLALLP